MKKNNYWNLALGDNHANKFVKEIKRNVEASTLIYLQNFGRVNWIPVEELMNELGKYQNFDFHSPEATKYFFLLGASKEIIDSTHRLRKLTYPVISGHKGQGYRYADENCENVVEVWTMRFRAWMDRKLNIRKEEEIDTKILEKIIERIKDENKKKELLMIYNNYKHIEKNKELE